MQVALSDMSCLFGQRFSNSSNQHTCKELKFPLSHLKKAQLNVSAAVFVYIVVQKDFQEGLIESVEFVVCMACKAGAKYPWRWLRFGRLAGFKISVIHEKVEWKWQGDKYKGTFLQKLLEKVLMGLLGGKCNDTTSFNV